MISIDVARKWDRLLGIPICYFISVFRFFSKKKKFEKENVKQIIIIKMWGMGSLVLAGPAINALKSNFPSAEISLLTLESNKGLLDWNSEINSIYYFSLLSPFRLLVNSFKLIIWMWKRKPDLVIDFETASRFTAILSFFNFKATTVGFSPAGSGKNIFDVTVPYHESVHVSNLFLRCVDALGLPLSEKKMIQFPIQTNSKINVDNWLEIKKINKFVLLNPNTSNLALERLWPLEHFAKVIVLISELYPELSIILIGNNLEYSRNEKVISLLDRNGSVVNSAGNFSVNELNYLIQKAEIMITNDSGPAQLGFNSPTPTIALYGPETPLLYGSENSLIHTNLTSHEPCSPCISIFNDKVVYCNKNAVCMKNLSVDLVFETFKKSILLKQKSV